MNQNYFEPNPGYDSNYSGFDQPPQYTIDHQPHEGMSKSDIVFEEIKMMFQQLMERLNEENQGKIKEINQERTISLRDIISQFPSSIVITTSPPVLPIEDPEVSLIMANEELSTIPEKESDEFIKSSVEDHVPILRDYHDLEGDIFYLESLLNDDLVHYDPSIPAMSVASILEEFIDELSLEENDGLFDLEPKNDDWKKILYDAPINNLMIEDKILDLGIHEKSFLRHMSEDTIFDPGIFAFHFSHRCGTFISFNVYPNILNESPMEIFPSTCFTPNIMMIWDSRARGFVHHPLELLSFTYGNPIS
nr:hypothetical protein [Tanacetum cinerariifolium]